MLKFIKNLLQKKAEKEIEQVIEQEIRKINYYNFKTDILKKALNNGFIRLVERIDGICFMKEGLIVIASIDRELDEKRWAHISMSRKKRMPTYNDLKYVKDVFVGDDKKAIMVLPEKKYHINEHPYCLHLFHCIDEDPIPEFSKFKSTL